MKLGVVAMAVTNKVEKDWKRKTRGGYCQFAKTSGFT
jgi:hypothetical protein